MTRALGSDLAKSFGDAHEAFSGNPPEERAVDLHNNAVGREIGARFRRRSGVGRVILKGTPRDVADAAQRALDEGLLTWVSGAR